MIEVLFIIIRLPLIFMFIIENETIEKENSFKTRWGYTKVEMEFLFRDRPVSVLLTLTVLERSREFFNR